MEKPLKELPWNQQCSGYEKSGPSNINHVQFFSVQLKSQDKYHSSQRMGFSTSALHISVSAQDIKILNTIYIP